MGLPSKFVCGRFVAQDILSYRSLYFVNRFVTFEYILCQDLHVTFVLCQDLFSKHLYYPQNLLTYLLKKTIL